MPCSTWGSQLQTNSLKQLTVTVHVAIIIIIIKTYLCRMTISVIRTAINMGPAIFERDYYRKDFNTGRAIIKNLDNFLWVCFDSNQSLRFFQ